MKRISIFLLILFLTVPLFAKTKIIFDADIDTDCDDAGAMAVLHALADNGEAEILATIVSSRFPYCAPCVEAINRYYGRPDIPIGAPKTTWADTGARGSAYAQQIATENVTTLNSNNDALDAVDVYRQILAGQEDSSVVILTVGYLTNIRDLLESGPDEFSTLNGVDLVIQKVTRWVQTGAAYPSDYNPAIHGNYPPDPSSACIAFQNWPEAVPMYISGKGTDILTGSLLPSTPANNPVRRAYELRVGLGNTRASWDQIGTLFAVRPNDPRWTFRTGGYYHIFDNGTYEWRNLPDKNQTVLEYNTSLNPGLIQTLDQLMTQAPAAPVPPPETTYFTGGDLLTAGNWTAGLPAGRVAVINSNGYATMNQINPWISGSTATVDVGAVLSLSEDLSAYGGTIIVNDATINCADDVFCDNGNMIFNEGSVTTAGDDWEANDHAGRITVNGGTHSSGPGSEMWVGAQGNSGRVGCGIDFRGGTVTAGDFRFQEYSSSSIGGGAILTSASPTTVIADLSGDMDFISGWTGYWEVGSFGLGDWKTLLTSGANITLDGTAIDAARFDNKFMVSADGKTLSSAIPDSVPPYTDNLYNRGLLHCDAVVTNLWPDGAANCLITPDDNSSGRPAVAPILNTSNNWDIGIDNSTLPTFKTNSPYSGDYLEFDGDDTIRITNAWFGGDNLDLDLSFRFNGLPAMADNYAGMFWSYPVKAYLQNTGDDTHGKVMMLVYDAAGSPHFFSSTKILNSNVWYHLSFSASNDNLKVVVGNESEGDVTDNSSATGLLAPGEFNNVIIGSDFFDFTRSFQGDLDEIRWGVIIPEPATLLIGGLLLGLAFLRNR